MTHTNQLIPCFSGFYSSNWSYWIEQAEEYAKEWLIEHYGVDKEFVMNELDSTPEWRQECKEKIAQWYAETYYQLVSEYTNIDIELLETHIQSPKAYNYATDKIFATIRTKLSGEQINHRLWLLIEENYKELKEIIHDNHTSRDGFISFMSNDIDEWKELIGDDSIHPYIDYLLFYITYIKALKDQHFRAMDDRNTLDWAIYDAVVNWEFLDSPDLIAYTQESKDKWEEIQENIKEIDRKRYIDQNYPVIPGLTQN